ncbi:hypothetical protein Cs7R123_19650 [Catellatospora sp. TT07R-123]|nr:hypothetical protein Cs7R123_19650 [Catellatospora sp. TT07R-123]
MGDSLDTLTLAGVVDLLVKLVEFAGALIIFVGAALAFAQFVTTAVRVRRTESFTPIRLGLGRFLVLGLEFQLAGDILRTAIAPTLRDIGELAAIAAIRTALNFFLNREIRDERAELAAAAGPRLDPADDMGPSHRRPTSPRSAAGTPVSKGADAGGSDGRGSGGSGSDARISNGGSSDGGTSSGGGSDGESSGGGSSGAEGSDGGSSGGEGSGGEGSGGTGRGSRGWT